VYRDASRSWQSGKAAASALPAEGKLLWRHMAPVIFVSLSALPFHKGWLEGQVLRLFDLIVSHAFRPQTGAFVNVVFLNLKHGLVT
jgi:hypothetical protein